MRLWRAGQGIPRAGQHSIHHILYLDAQIRAWQQGNGKPAPATDGADTANVWPALWHMLGEVSNRQCRHTEYGWPMCEDCSAVVWDLAGPTRGTYGLRRTHEPDTTDMRMAVIATRAAVEVLPKRMRPAAMAAIDACEGWDGRDDVVKNLAAERELRSARELLSYRELEAVTAMTELSANSVNALIYAVGAVPDPARLARKILTEFGEWTQYRGRSFTAVERDGWDLITQP